MAESLIESRRLAVHGLVLAAVGGLIFFAGCLAMGARQSFAFAILPVAAGMLSVGTTVFAGSLADKFSATKGMLWLAAALQITAAILLGLQFLDALPFPRHLFAIGLVLPMFGVAAYCHTDAIRLRLLSANSSNPTAVLMTGVGMLIVVAAITLSVLTLLERASLWGFVLPVFSQLLLSLIAGNFVIKARELPLTETNTAKEAFWFRWLGGARLFCGLLLIAAGIYFGLWQQPLTAGSDWLAKMQLAAVPAIATAIGLHWSISGAMNLAGRYPWIPVSLGSGIGISLLFWSVATAVL